MSPSDRGLDGCCSARESHVERGDTLPLEPTRPRGPKAELRGALADALLQSGVAEPADDYFPSKWEKIGDVVLISNFGKGRPAGESVHNLTPRQREALFSVVASKLKARCVGLQGVIETSLHRKSTARIVWPESTTSGWTEHRCNGILYGLDVTKSMFSSGNGTEKARVGRFSCEGEIVVDLYAGIGYFTIPYLVQARAAHVHACEWDRDALAALAHNLRRNKVEGRCSIHAGDNAGSLCAFEGAAHRVNLGLIPSSEAGWPIAVRALRDEGGWLHVHANVPQDQQGQDTHVGLIVDKLSLLVAAAGRRWDLRVEHVERVKRYAPRILHVVVDVLATLRNN